jgi:hypothetical protein
MIIFNKKDLIRVFFILIDFLQKNLTILADFTLKTIYLCSITNFIILTDLQELELLKHLMEK